MSGIDDLERRISEALDLPGGLAADDALRAEIEASPEAKRIADALLRIDAGLRDLATPEMSEDAFEALATRIEQRLDEALPKLDDPTTAPKFDDADAKREPGAPAVRGAYVPPKPGATPKKPSGEFSLANLTKLSVREEAAKPKGMKPLPGKPAPAARAPVTPAARAKPSAAGAAPAPAPAPAAVAPRDSATEISEADLESIPPAAAEPHAAPHAGPHSAHAPPPPPPAAKSMKPATPVPSAPSAKPSAKAPSKAAAPATEERAKIPSVRPAAAAVAPLELSAPISIDEQRRKKRALFYVSGAIAAAAVVGLAVVAGLSTQQAAEETVAMAPTASMSEDTARQGAGMPAPAAPPATASPIGGYPSERGAARGGGIGAADSAEGTEVTANTTTLLAEPDPAVTGAVMPTEQPAEEEAPAAAAETESEPPPEPVTRTRVRRTRATSSAQDRSGARNTGTSSSSAGGSSGSSSSAGGGGGTPTREQVVAALRAVQPAVSACRASRGGVVEVDITVSGSSGRVRNALVVGEFAGTREGSCVARAVRTARFPTFSRDSFHVRYPFQL